MNRLFRSAVCLSRQAGAGRNWVRMGSTYKSKVERAPAHYDEMPVPQGSWKLAYDQNQRKFNTHLIVGLSLLVFTVYFAKNSGVIFFNFLPPPLPGEPGADDACEQVVVAKKC